MIKLLLTSFVILTFSFAAHAQLTALVKATFVGCNSDGQVGPLPAPTDSGRAPLIPQTFAQDLAFYEPEHGVGTLAPRGWYCFGYYGSSGAFLIVSPDPAYGKDYLTTIPEITGPAIQIIVDDAETSGRFGVAAIDARLFPSQRKFVEKIIAENIEPASAFPFGPYPNDIIIRRSDYDVSFETPANKDGMGTAGADTDSYLRKNNYPILGEAFIVGDGPNIEGAITLDIRLPPNLRYLAPIIFSTERQSAVPPGQ